MDTYLSLSLCMFGFETQESERIYVNGHRGVVEEEERHRGVGVREEDVKRMLRVIMPYLNESLLQLRALFSGDPSTTLKVSPSSPASSLY